MKSLLLLHGALGSKEQFDKIEKLLSSSRQTHSFNFSGHGKTPSREHAFTIQNLAHEVLNYLNEHQIQQVDFFGYSMGGYVALWLARFYPERVGKIFTLGTKMDWSKEATEREIKFLNPDKTIEKVPAFAEQLAAMHGQEEWHSVMSKTAHLMKDLSTSHLTAEDFQKITSSVCLGLGDHDNMVTKQETEAVQKALKNASIKILIETAHPFEKVSPPLLTKELLSFLN